MRRRKMKMEMEKTKLIEAFARKINEGQRLNEDIEPAMFGEHIPEILEALRKSYNVNYVEDEERLYLEEPKYLNLASVIYADVKYGSCPDMEDWYIQLRGSLTNLLQSETRIYRIQNKLNNAAQLMEDLLEDIEDIKGIISDVLFSIEEEQID